MDILSFGSEAGDIDEIIKTADAMLNENFEKEMSAISSDKALKGIGYPEKLELALKRIDGDFSVSLTPNNILAIEYVKSLRRIESRIIPHTVKRVGADFDEENILAGELQSATAIRERLLKSDISALEYIPNYSKYIYLDELANGSFPCDTSKLSSAVISSFRLNSHACPDTIPDTAGGLYNRLKSKALMAQDLDSLLRLTETKVYTRARVRRVILYSFLGVTSSEIHEMPLYTQVLAMDEIGKTVLKIIGKETDIQILTKPSKVDGFSEAARRQWEQSFRADSVFQLTKPTPKDGRLSLTTSPYVKK